MINTGKIVGILLIWSIWIAGGIGWTMNICQLATQYDTMPVEKLVLKIAGVFAAPLGSLMGFIG